MQFFPSAYSRPDANLPEARLLNMYFERTPGGPEPNALLQRPGIVASWNLGTGPIRGMFKQDGVGSGNLYVATGAEIRTFIGAGGTLVGTLSTSDGICRFAAGSYLVVVDVSDGTAWTCLPAFAKITDVDLPSVSDVAYFQGRYYYAEKGETTFYWSAIGDPTSIDGLAFASTETSPDSITGIVALGDDLVFLCQESVEFYYGTSDPTAPVQRYQNRSFSRGCASQTSIVKMDNTIYWLGNDRIPYRAGAVPESLIDAATGNGHGVAERLRKLSDPSLVFCYAVQFDGHNFYVMNIPSSGTFAYDSATGQWHQWTSYGNTTFRARYSVALSDMFLGSDANGKIYSLSSTTYQDDGDAMERIASSFIPVNDGVARCDQVALYAKVSAEAAVDVRKYDTAWDNWDSTTTVNGKASWRRKGLIQAPGSSFEFRTSANAGVTITGLKLNPRRP